MRASEMFAEAVGQRALMMNPVARAFFESMRQYERHHATKHADCEEQSARDIRMMAEYVKGGLLIPDNIPGLFPDGLDGWTHHDFWPLDTCSKCGMDRSDDNGTGGKNCRGSR